MKLALIALSLFISLQSSADCTTTRNCVEYSGSGADFQCHRYETETRCEPESKGSAGCYVEDYCVSWEADSPQGHAVCYRYGQRRVCR